MATTTVLEALKGVNAYPIPQRTFEEYALRRGITLSESATQEVLCSKAYNLVVADLLSWLALAPNISQGGQSYAFNEEQRAAFRRRAFALYREFGEEGGAPKTIFGYKGSRL